MKKIKNLCNLVVSNFVSDKRAQSAVLGFVIIMGIVLSASLILFSLQVPEQTKKFEAEHASKVPHDFAALSSAIDEVALSGDETASATCDFGMAPETVPFLGIHASGGTLSFDTTSERFECLAYAPGEPIATGSGFWSCTPNDFLAYNKFHVDTFPGVGAKLKLETGEDRIYNSSGDEYLSGELWVNNFSVTNNTTLYTPWLTVHAKNITIGPNSSINAIGRGMAGGTTILVWGTTLSDSGKGEGGGKIPDPPCRHPSYGYCYCGAGGGGAGHYSPGGTGGGSYTSDTFWHPGGDGGPTYENVTNTSTDMSTTASGSGGACAAWGQVANGYIYEGGAGGDGGGIIHLDAPTINIMGNVSVDGEKGHYSNDEDRADDSAGGGGGGGSGGTIFLKGGNINISDSGHLSAKGGDGADGAKACDDSSTYDSNGGGGGGGSGGVIKIFYSIYLSTPGELANHTDVCGGAGGHGGVGNGTYCSGPPYPTPGGDGSPGGDGLVHNESYPGYIESVPHYSTGWLISRVSDTGSEMVRYGNITWSELTLSGTSIYMKVRTCTNADMTGAMPWENCPGVTNETDISNYPSVSDGHRYIQWRADLHTFERFRTPILHSVNISYEYGLPVIENSSGSIVFGSHYLYLPNYKLVYAHGATIKSQSTGEFVFHPPPITIRKDGSTTSLAISSVNLTGSEESVSGAFCSAVKASYEDADLLTGGLNFHNLTLNITTDFPTAWRNWFHETCEKEGLVNGTAAGNYFIIGSGTSDHPLSIVFYGNESRPVNLWLKETEVAIKVEG